MSELAKDPLALGEFGDAFVRAFQELTDSIAAFGRALNRSRHAFERLEAQREYERGRLMAELYPDHWEVFCVTTNEGRCRVISRPRGGWAL